MAASWRIELFGGMRVSSGERSFAFLQAPKAGLLLAYLAYFPRHPHPREQLLELLWPESDPETSRHNLRSLLHALRRQLEPAKPTTEPLLLAERAALRLNPTAFSTDVAEFTAALQQAARTFDAGERARRLAAAVDLYQGELLAGFYDPWVLAERQRLEEQYLGALQQLVLALEESGDLEQAIEYAQQAVSADPLREEAHYDMMRLYAAAGQPSATLRQYQGLERLLREELGETPSAAARALAEELRQNARTVVVARSLTSPERGGGERDLPLPAASEPIPEPGAASPRPAEHSVVAHPPESAEPPATAPAPASVPHGLPVQFTRFFGREEEIARVTETLCVPENRLVTLTGPGGSGKTRLAIAVAGRLQAQFAGGMAEATGPAGTAQDEPARLPPIGLWFVPLTEITEARRIGDAVREAMRLPPAATGGSLEQVIAALSTWSSAAQPGYPQRGRVPSGAGWLLLDNFEHLVDEGAPLVRRLLERVPSLKLLITSRRRLELEGEHELAVLPLPTPRASDIGFLESLIAYPSVQLFVDRARAARPEFRLTEANAGAVARLCDRLEGLPLAIELAAGRTGVLTPEQMLERLADTGARGTGTEGGGRFELLVSRRRDVSARHRSLWAAMEGSYQSLTPELQRFFARLSVFRGGWTLEAAEAICGDFGFRAVEYLEHLRESSLIVAEETPGGGAMRYRMLETLREFAAEKQGPEEREAARARQAAYFLTLAETQTRGGGPAEGRWLDCMEREYENLRAAREWFADAGRPELELRLAEVAQYLWETRGHGRDARGWLEHALGGLIERDETRARALHLAGRMAYHDDDAALAQRCWEESLAIMREVDNKQGIANALNYLGNIAYVRQNYDTARSLWEESLAIMREVNDRQGMAHCLVNLGGLAHMQGDTAAARRFWEECRALDEAMGVRGGHVLWLLGILAREQGDAEEARRLWRQHLMESLEFNARCETVLGELASYAVEDGHLEQGARLWGAVSALRERRDLSLRIVLSEKYEQERSHLRARLGEAAFEAAFAQGRALTLEQAIEYAVAGPV